MNPPGRISRGFQSVLGCTTADHFIIVDASTLNGLDAAGVTNRILGMFPNRLKWTKVIRREYMRGPSPADLSAFFGPALDYGPRDDEDDKEIQAIRLQLSGSVGHASKSLGEAQVIYRILKDGLQHRFLLEDSDAYHYARVRGMKVVWTTGAFIHAVTNGVMNATEVEAAAAAASGLGRNQLSDLSDLPGKRAKLDEEHRNLCD